MENEFTYIGDFSITTNNQYELQAGELEDSIVINVTGRIDGISAQEFHDKVYQEIQDLDHHIVMDFNKLSYINSAGLRSILFIAKELRKKSKMFILCSLPDPVMQVIKTSGFDKIIDICETRSAAMAKIAG